MRTEALRLMRETYGWLMLTLEEGRRDGSMRFEGDAHDKALVVGAALQGGLQIARLSGAHRFRHLLNQLEFELTGNKPQSGPLTQCAESRSSAASARPLCKPNLASRAEETLLREDISQVREASARPVHPLEIPPSARHQNPEDPRLGEEVVR